MGRLRGSFPDSVICQAFRRCAHRRSHRPIGSPPWSRAFQCRQGSAFVANISHEIRTPLAAMGHTDVMTLGDLAPKDYTDYVQTVRRNSVHVLSILNDVLDMSKLEAVG